MPSGFSFPDPSIQWRTCSKSSQMPTAKNPASAATALVIRAAGGAVFLHAVPVGVDGSHYYRRELALRPQSFQGFGRAKGGRILPVVEK